MKLKVPFFKQTSSQNCGPTALKMVLAYFGRNENIRLLEEKTGINEGKGITTIQIAIASASLGYKTDFYSKHILFNEENMKKEYYQKFSDMNLEKSKKLLSDVKEIGINVREETMTLNNIISFVKKNSIPNVLLDWNIVISKKEKGYQGHFVPVIGFDKKNVYVPGQESFMPIPKEIFDEARKADGTDEDVVIVYNK